MAGLVLLALMGCQPDDPGPSPTTSLPVTSASATPQATTVTPSPTSSEDELYAEAEAVYRAYWKADLEVSVAGGADTLPPSVAQYVMGDYALGTEARYKQDKENGFQVRKVESAKIAWTQPAANGNGSIAAIESCIDSTKLEWKDNSTGWGPGGIVRGTYYLKRDSAGVLKIFVAKADYAEACS